MVKIKNVFVSLVVVAMLSTATAARGGEWLYIDVIVCETPPKYIQWNTLVVKIAVWDEKNPNAVVDVINPTLGGSLYYSDHYLPGTIDIWNAWIWPGKKRTYGYDGKWYQVRWQDVADYDNKASNYSTMHLDFEWRIDPDQSEKPDETTAKRLFQWQGRW